MSVRAWVFAVAIGLMACLGQAQELTDGEQGQSENQENATQALPIPLPIQIFEDDAQSEARERDEKEVRQREIDDLAAQQGMNKATRSMNEATQEMRDYAYVQTWLVGIGTLLLVVTLLLTLGANKAARDAVKITRVIGEAQTRAYVHVQLANLIGISSGNPEVAIGITNFGNSPARNISIGTRRIIGDFRQEVVADGADARTVIDLAPGQSTNIRYPVDPAYIESANNSVDANKLTFIAVGIIRYRDSFSENFRETRFAFNTWPANQIVDGQLDTRINGNSST